MLIIHQQITRGGDLNGAELRLIKKKITGLLTDSKVMDCYDYPQYWDLAFRDSTREEANFVDAVSLKFLRGRARRIFEPGCGGGRLVVELARRGYDVTAIDLSQPAISYLKKRLRRNQLDANVRVADMLEFTCHPPVDIAINTVNTFRHLLTESQALTHLKLVASGLKKGGFYILGFHLLPPDAALEDRECWTQKHAGISVHMTLDAFHANRRKRTETLRFRMQVKGGQTTREFTTDYQMRIYTAAQVKTLFSKAPQFELVEVYDFFYDIDEPQPLDDRLGDAVFLLRRV